MEGRAKGLSRCRMGRFAVWITHTLVTACLLAFGSLGPPAHAQAPRIAISELTFSHQGPDNTREYIEIANLGDAPWDPNNHWIMRVADPDDVPQLFVRIQGVDPVPAGGVLLAEWGRPIEGVTCSSGGNIFCTGRTDFSTDELRPEMSLAVLGPTPNNEPPTIADSTMLAYYFQGDVNNIDREAHGYDKALAGKLWRDGDAVPTGPLIEWGVGLRMGPGGYPTEHGRRASDYFLQLTGFPSLNSANDQDFREKTPYAPPPNTGNRPGTPGRVNYIHPGTPIPGQIAAEFTTVYLRATAATLAANAPPTGLQLVSWNTEGQVASSLYSNNAWSPWARLAGTPAVNGLTLLNNPQRASRTLIMKSKDDGALVMSTAGGDREQSFAAPVALNLKAQFPAAAAVDPATGTEHYLAVEADTGAIQHNVNEGGKLRGWQPIAGVTTDAPVTAAWSTDPAGLNVVAWNGNQLVLNRMGADGKFGAWQNIGAPVSERPERIEPAVVWNAQAKRLEIVAVVGTAEANELQHTRVELTAAGEAKPAGAPTKITLNTNAPLTLAVDPEAGQLRLLARGGGPEPGLNPRVDNEPGGPQSGFALETMFDGTAWSAPRRLGTGRLPGPSEATQLFTRTAAPVTVFDPNTRRFHDFLIGEDAQIYHNAPSP